MKQRENPIKFQLNFQFCATCPNQNSKKKKNELDYKFDFNFVSCILSKFSNFCVQINDALTFNTEANKTTMIMLIGLSKNILPAHFYGDHKLDSNLYHVSYLNFLIFVPK